MSSFHRLEALRCSIKTGLVGGAALLAGCLGSVGERSGPAANAGPGSQAPPAAPPAGVPGSSSPGGAAPGGAIPGTPTACGAKPRRIWKLTPVQYSRSVAALFPGVPDAGTRIAASVVEGEGFSNDAGRLAMTGPHVNALLDSAWQLGADAATQPARLSPCLGSTPASPTCLSELARQLGGRAFRRDLTGPELDRLAAFLGQRLAAADVSTALRQFVMYLLASPEFLFRSELGGDPRPGQDTVMLTDFEKASALSYWLTDGPPDAPLLEAARRGDLASRDQIATHTRRLLASADTAPGLLRFFRENFQLDEVREARKDPLAFPQWSDALADDLAREGEGLVAQVLWGEGARLNALLNANFTMANAPLATFYGLPAAGLDGRLLRKLPLPARERAGLLTTGGLMAARASDTDTSPVMRGLFLRQAVLCQDVPPPPPSIDNVPPPIDGKHTQRERLANHSGNPSCAGCHGLMDPLGLAFEPYDAVGRYRATDVGQAIDASGSVQLDGRDVRFSGPVELAQALADSREVAGCFLSQAWQYAAGRAPEAADGCALHRLSNAFAASGGDMIELAVAITTDDSFFVRAITP